ncbi:MAG: acyl-CoA dehydrogenase family protein [Candidatus Binatia bacterium]
MIDFELSPELVAARDYYHRYAAERMRPISREFDEREHERPWEFIRHASEMSRSGQAPAPPPAERNLFTVIVVEEMSWGDAGLYLLRPGSGLGTAAIIAAGTTQQRERLLGRFRDSEPRWAAMAITEPGCGSDTSAIQTTAVRDGDHWVLNGTKVFCTNGALALAESDGLTVVWATVDKAEGRGGIKAFVVEAGTPGVQVAKLEHKLGIRVSDTAELVFENCRVPADNLLGDLGAKKEKSGSFKGAMATFDATRPIVAAQSVGLATAALDLLRGFLSAEGSPLRYGLSAQHLGAVERDVMELEAEVEATRLLTWRAAWMMDRGQRNSLEASIAKAKAGQMVTKVTQRVVEHLGPLGYSRELLAEKWMRDAKINDIFEGTQQINLLIIARRIFGYGSGELN